MATEKRKTSGILHGIIDNCTPHTRRKKKAIRRKRISLTRQLHLSVRKKLQNSFEIEKGTTLKIKSNQEK
jgi:hypothetical protein